MTRLAPISARRGIESPTVIASVLQAAGGHPLALALAADLVTQFGIRGLAATPEWHLAVRTLVERLLRDVDDPNLRTLLEAAATVRQFDESTLRALAGEQAVTATFARFCELAIVRPTPRGLMLHDDARRILADDLRWRDPTRHADLRTRALVHYRIRSRAATTLDEQEALFTERLFLWENALIRDSLFAHDEPGEVWVEPGRPQDHEDARKVWRAWLERYFLPRLGTQFDDLATEERIWEQTLNYAGTRLRIVRDYDGEVVGIGAVLPICKESLQILDDHPLGLLPRTFWSSSTLATLPESWEQADAFYFVHNAHGDWNPRAVIEAVLRDFVATLVNGGLYFCTTPFPEHKPPLEALGFLCVPGTRTNYFGEAYPSDGFVLDLRGVGVDAWLEALMAGRKPPRPLHGEELEQALRDALLHWHDDAYLRTSPLLELASARVSEVGVIGAEAVRQAVEACLTAARERGGTDAEPAYHALELAYMQPGPSHERIAERLSVSRATLFRLLTRGIRGLAGTWLTA